MDFKEAVQQNRFRSPQVEAALNIIFTANQLQEISRDQLKPYNLSGEQYNVLRILRGKHPEAYSLNEIRDRMLNRWSNASRLVDKLKKKKYVTRQLLESNRRKVEIRITEKGINLLDELENLPIAVNLYDRGLSKQKAKQLTNLLDEFRSNLEKHLHQKNK